MILSFNCGNKGSVVNEMKLKDSSKVIGGNMNQIASSSLHEPVLSLGAAKWRNTDTSLVSFESISLRFVIFLRIISKLHKAIYLNVFPSFAE